MALAESPLFDPTVADSQPFERWRLLRDEAPLYRNEELDFYMLSRHADVKAVHMDWRAYSSAGGVVLDLMKNPAAVEEFRNMLFEDPPIHDLHRRMLAAVFTPRRVSELESSVRTLTRRYLEGWGEGEYEFVERMASKLPMAVVGALLGVPESDYDYIAGLVNRYTDRSSAEASGLAPRAELKAYLGDLVRQSRREPGDGLISALANLTIDDDGTERPLTDDEAVNQSLVLALAGNETTNRLFGFVADTLGRYPEQRRLLVEHPELCSGAVEEVLRYECPAYFYGRIPTEDVEWHGQVVPAGSYLMLHIGAASHDERAFEDPERFDVTRKLGNKQLGLGAGIHVCLGAPLARLETRIAIEEMLALCPDWRCDYENAEFAVTPATRGWKTLPILFGA